VPDSARLERLADRRLAHEHHRIERLENKVNATEPKHGDAALEAALNPRPTGRSSLHGFTIRAPKKPEYVPTGRIGKPVPKALRAVEAIPIVFAPTPRRAVPKKAVAGRPDMIIAAEDEYGQPPIPVKVAPKTRVRGPEAIITYLRKKGVVVALAADKVHLLVQTEGGHPLMLGERALVEVSAPLLVAFLRAEPLTCGVKWAHAKGTDTAVTLLVGGTPACAGCMAERG
jgi:hypothetical protein